MTDYQPRSTCVRPRSGSRDRLTAPLILLALTLAAGLSGSALGSTAGIFTWTDRNGVVHFSDSPPPPEPQPSESVLALDEDTPIPLTLNELFEPASAGLPATPEPVLLEIEPTGSASRWERGQAALPGSDEARVLVDQHGPFTIGDVVDDVRLPREALCQWARRDLEILTDNWPIYRDPGGRLRFQWARDPYRGARRYLDPAARSTALATARATLQRECDTPDDARAQAAARDWLLRSALCEAERAELSAMERLGDHHPTQSIADKRELMSNVCAETTAL
jgi:hypothetical protein